VNGALSESTRDPIETARVTDAAALAFAEAHPEKGAPVVVIIPALNEEETVADVVSTVPDQLCGLDVDVLVIDDGSRDATAEKAGGAGALVARLEANTGQAVAEPSSSATAWPDSGARPTSRPPTPTASSIRPSCPG
jgi:hypothetical protein